MKSRVYKFHGLNACRGRGKIETSAALKVFLNKFGLRGIRIHTLYADNEFDKIKAHIAPIHVECCGRDEHVPDIELNMFLTSSELFAQSRSAVVVPLHHCLTNVSRK